MAVNTEEIGRVYNALAGKVTNTLKTLLDDYSITEKERAQVVSNTMSVLIQTSVQAVLDEPVKVAQIAASNAQAAASNAEASVRTTQSAKDSLVKDAQKSLIDAQKETEAEKKALTIRQKTFYDDHLRMAEAKELSGMVQMGLVSGGTPDATMVSKAYSAIDAITP